MLPSPDAQRIKAQLLIWWIIWAAVLTGLVVIYLVIGRAQPMVATRGAHPLIGLVGLVPLFVSIVIRWLVLPRFRDLTRALPMFIVGLALAEGCGLLGIFLGGVYRDDVFLLGVFGVAQFLPIFARRIAEPKPEGFFQNN
jgi:hypothetical protein